MSDIKFYVCDTETSGLSLEHHEITEISIIRASDRMQLTKYIRAHHPENASWDALKVTGKTMDDLRTGCEKIDAIREVEQFISEDGAGPSHRALVCHNVSFDRKFLCALWEKYNKKFPFDLYLDTIHMFKDYSKQRGLIKPKANLTNACEVAGIKKVGEAHNAKTDTRHTYLLWEEMSKKVDWLSHIKHLPHNIEL